MLVNASLFSEVVLGLPRGTNVWEFYANVHSKGYSIEPVGDTLFTTYKLEPPISRSTTSLASLHSAAASVGQQQIVRSYAQSLPPGFESFVTVASHCLVANSGQPPSPEALTQHIQLLFVRGFHNSGISIVENLIRTLLGVHMVQGPAHFHIITNALRAFIAPPSIASREDYTLHTKKWFLSFVRGFLLLDLPLAQAAGYSWAGEASPTTINPIIPGAFYLLINRDGRGTVLGALF